MPGRSLVHQLDQTVLFRVRQRTEQDAVHDAEHRRRGADAQRERQRGDDREARGAQQGTPSIADDREGSLRRKRQRNSSRVRSLARSRPPNLIKRLSARLVCRHAGAHGSSRSGGRCGSGSLRRGRLSSSSRRAERTKPAPALDQAAHHAPPPSRVASSTRLIARDMRRHSASSSFRWRRPCAVQRVVPGAPVVRGHAPFGPDEALPFEPVERGIQRALSELQHALRPLLDAFGDAPAVHRFEAAMPSEPACRACPAALRSCPWPTRHSLSTDERNGNNVPSERKGKEPRRSSDVHREGPQVRVAVHLRDEANGRALARREPHRRRV